MDRITALEEATLKIAAAKELIALAWQDDTSPSLSSADEVLEWVAFCLHSAIADLEKGGEFSQEGFAMQDFLDHNAS